ncbi:MAG: hypothetical protein OXT73_04910 [Bacteroidota bacterium]|nr:hypothetical protein [Bacteroidota bacterium]
MKELLSVLTPADYRFLAGIMESPLNQTNDSEFNELVSALEQDDSESTRANIERQFEEDLRYVGSSEIMYAFRALSGQERGVPFQEIVRDVAHSLSVDANLLGSDREVVERLAESYATQQFADLPPEEQQKMLEELGVEADKAKAFLARSAGVFALPMLIEAFNIVVVQGLIKTIIFGTIARIIGSQLASRLFAFLVARMPWWVSWIGPAAWTLSVGWTALDLQGPAKRKTIPVVLYLGLCSLRERHGTAPVEDASAEG